MERRHGKIGQGAEMMKPVKVKVCLLKQILLGLYVSRVQNSYDECSSLMFRYRLGFTILSSYWMVKNIMKKSAT